MTAAHVAPDGGACHLLAYGWHGVIRVYGSVAWEAVRLNACPALTSLGVFECFACGVSKMRGDAGAAIQHARLCFDHAHKSSEGSHNASGTASEIGEL
ncbi:hypothetical protein [Nonomuraea wenchangensis]|uniref:hypothetical protein n=1 Tax=Nonomuraea wenchangensis TaxID=568860 RepID=UPI003333F424